MGVSYPSARLPFRMRWPLQALMKIIKSCREAMPSPVSGCVVGLLVDNELEITDSFATKRTVAPTDEFDNAGVQAAMLSCLADIGADSAIAGWYQSTPFASECTVELVHSQFEFQTKIPSSIVIVYDPIAAGAGALPIKALRLTKAFMAAMSGSHSAAALAADRLKSSVLSSTVFEELPLRLHVNPVMSALLLDIAAPKPGSAAAAAPAAGASAGARFRGSDGVATPLEGDALTDLDRLEFSSPAYLERHLRLLSDQVTEMVAPVVNAQVWARREAKAQAAKDEVTEARRAEEKASDELLAEARRERLAAEGRAAKAALNEADQRKALVSRRDALLSAAQASVYCKELASVTSRKFGKLFLASALHASD